MRVTRDIAQRVVAVCVCCIYAAALEQVFYRLKTSWHVVIVAAMRSIGDVVTLADIYRIGIVATVVWVVADGFHSLFFALRYHVRGVRARPGG